MTNDLVALAALIRQRNRIARRITGLIGRPAQLRQVGEYIVSCVFHIQLADAANQRGSDGWFSDGPLRGRTVNIKWYVSHERTLGIPPSCLPDYFLVLTGPLSPAYSSRRRVYPWLIERAFLFDARRLIHELKCRGVSVDATTSVARSFWAEAELYPVHRNLVARLSARQRRALALFG